MRRQRFTVDDMVEKRYRAQLRAIAHQVDMIVKSFPGTDAHSVKELERALEAYAQAIQAWAAKAALLMLKDSKRNSDLDWNRALGNKLYVTAADPNSAESTTNRSRMVATFTRNSSRFAGVARRACW